MLLEGRVELCDKNGDCKTVATPCALLRAEPGRDVEEIEAGKGRVQETSTDFPFQTPESGLSNEFQLVGLGCLLVRPTGTVSSVSSAPPLGPGDRGQDGTSGGVEPRVVEPPVIEPPVIEPPVVEAPGDNNNGIGNGDSNANTGQDGLGEGDRSNPAHGNGSPGNGNAGGGGGGGGPDPGVGHESGKSNSGSGNGPEPDAGHDDHDPGNSEGRNNGRD
jgi:hypothetical protein